MLIFEGAWRFDSPGPIPDEVRNAFFELIGRIATPDNRKAILEHFKDYFASAAGSSSSYSSSTSWAESDLLGYMGHAASNSPLFIEAFYDGCQSLAKGRPPTAVPDLSRINRILYESGSGYQIQPPNLVTTNLQTQIVVPRPGKADVLFMQGDKMDIVAAHKSAAPLLDGNVVVAPVPRVKVRDSHHAKLEAHLRVAHQVAVLFAVVTNGDSWQS